MLCAVATRANVTVSVRLRSVTEREMVGVTQYGWRSLPAFISRDIKNVKITSVEASTFKSRSLEDSAEGKINERGKKTLICLRHWTIRHVGLL